MLGVTGEQRHAAENAIEQSRFRHRGNHRHRTLGKQELEEFGADALTRQLVEAGAPGNAGGKPRRIGRALAIGGMKAKETQDTEIVFGDARGGIADEAHASCRDVGQPAHIIVDGAVARSRQRVHGEVAPLGIPFPVSPERHLRMTPEGLDILAQSCDLERLPMDDNGNGAVLDPGGHRLEAGGLSPADHLRRQRGGGNVDFANRLGQHRVAHRAADHTRLLAAAVEHGQQVPERRLLQPRGVEATQDLRHLVSPGTNRPSSIRAGT